MNPENQLMRPASGPSNLPNQSGGPSQMPGLPMGGIADQNIPGQQPTSPIATVHRVMRGRYKWAILLAIVTGSIGAVAGWLSEQPTYQSVGFIRVQPQLDPYLFSNDATKPMPMFESFMSAQSRVIESRRVVEKAMRSDTWQSIDTQTTDEATGDFISALRVRNSGQIIYITFLDEDRQAAMRGVQSVINAYMEIFGERDQLEDARRIQALEDRRTKLNAEVRSNEQRINALANIYGTEQLDEMYQMKLETVNAHEIELNEVTRALADVEAALSSEEGIENTLSEYTPEEIAVYSPSMAALINQQKQLTNNYERLKRTRGEQHTSVKDLKLELELLEARIQDETDTFRRRGGTGIGDPTNNRITQLRMKQRLESLKEIYEKGKAELLDLGRTRLAIRQLMSEKRNLTHQLNETRQRIDSLNFELAGRNRIEVIDPGNWPVSPARDDRKKKAIFGLMLGGTAGVGLVLVFGAMNQRYRYLDDAKSSVGHVRVLGILPKLPEDLSHPEHAAIAAHCVHQIRTLLQIGRGDESTALSVTSPAAGDGKTSLALALGLSFAASGCRTLMVDCDIIGGGLTQRLDVIVRKRIGRLLVEKGLLAEAQLQESLTVAEASGQPIGAVLIEKGFIKQADLDEALAEQTHTRVGLVDVLQNEPLEECVADTGMSNLSILPLGSADIRDIGKLSPAGIRKVIRQGKQLYDVVLFDTGPSPGSLESSLVASEVEGVVLTVSRGEQRHMAEQAVKHLQSVGAHVAGLVFNRAETRDVEIYGSTSRVSARSGSLNLEPFEDLQVGDQTEKSRYGPVAYVTARSLPENSGRTTRGRGQIGGSTPSDLQAPPKLPPSLDEFDEYRPE